MGFEIKNKPDTVIYLMLKKLLIKLVENMDNKYILKITSESADDLESIIFNFKINIEKVLTLMIGKF